MGCLSVDNKKFISNEESKEIIKRNNQKCERGAFITALVLTSLLTLGAILATLSTYHFLPSAFSCSLSSTQAIGIAIGGAFISATLLTGLLMSLRKISQASQPAASEQPQLSQQSQVPQQPQAQQPTQKPALSTVTAQLQKARDFGGILNPHFSKEKNTEELD